MTVILTRAWLILVASSMSTTVFAGVHPEVGPTFVLLCLTLAGAKAWVILSDYLGLRDAPTFRRAFTMILAAFLSLSALLYALPFAM